MFTRVTSGEGTMTGVDIIIIMEEQIDGRDSACSVS